MASLGSNNGRMRAKDYARIRDLEAQLADVKLLAKRTHKAVQADLLSADVSRGYWFAIQDLRELLKGGTPEWAEPAAGATALGVQADGN